jgi:hypothetical protein
MIAKWSAAELNIVETLTRKVKLLSSEQLLDKCLSAFGSFELVQLALRRLREANLLHQAVVNAHPRVNVTAPLAMWSPDDPKPDFMAVAKHAKARWNQAVCPTQVYWASARAANLFGSSSIRSPSIAQRDHDLLLGEVYVFFCTHRTSSVHCWVSEAAWPKSGPGTKNADAFLCSDDGRTSCAIESAGRSRREQMECFHQHCAAQNLPYELW